MGSEAEEDAKVGFARPELYSKRLGGDELPPNAHLFVVYGEAAEWGRRVEKMEASPILVFQDLVKEMNPKQESGFEICVTAIPESGPLDSPGDVLVFPLKLRVQNGVARAREIVDALVNGTELADTTPLETGAQVFVCAHHTRDARCGFCGPRIIAAVEAKIKEMQANVSVRACSHIGGHRHAGNAIVFRNDSANVDWLGYITNSEEDAEYLVDLALGAIETPNPMTWRGRLGMTEAEHKEFCQACMPGDIEDLAAKARNKPTVLFVLGGPGAGKGTQCAKIVDAFADFEHLSAGDLLRAERNDPNSENGELINNYIKEGKIVPVEITVQLLLNAMEASKANNFLIDGFPRNEDNLQGWKRVVKNSARVLGTLYFDCPEKVMESRLLERGKTSGRADDNIESIKKRFKTYVDSTKPIIDLFDRRNKCFHIVSDRDVDAIFDEVSALLQGKLGFTLKAAPGSAPAAAAAAAADAPGSATKQTNNEKKSESKVIFVLGGPGAGKGTQCANIVEDYDFEHLSAGDLLRAERNDPSSEHGKLISTYIKEGKIVPVEITVQLLLNAMNASESSNFLIDGFPRNADNLDGWKRVVGARARVLGCLFFDCPESVMEGRLLQRGQTSGRADDNIESIRKRFRTYANDTRPIIDQFQAQGRCFRIVADRAPQDIYTEVQQLLQDLGFAPRKPNVIFVLGGPGAGKGTQCEFLTETFNLCHLSAGDLLRAERNSPGSKYGTLISNYIKEGQIVPVEITVNLLMQAMFASGKANFLIDGFPRNLDNLQGWEKVASDHTHVLGCMFFDCDEKVMEARLLERGKSSGRADDNIESIRKRFHTYKSSTMPIIQTFVDADKCWRINSNRTKEQVRADVTAIVRSDLKMLPRGESRKAAASSAAAAAASSSGASKRHGAVHANPKVVVGAAAAALLLFAGLRFLRSRHADQ